MRGDVETMGRGGSDIRQQSELSVGGGGKDKGNWGAGGGVGGGGWTMATVRQKVTADYHSCTSPEQCLSCGFGGAALCTR